MSRQGAGQPPPPALGRAERGLVFQQEVSRVTGLTALARLSRSMGFALFSFLRCV